MATSSSHDLSRDSSRDSGPLSDSHPMYISSTDHAASPGETQNPVGEPKSFESRVSFKGSAFAAPPTIAHMENNAATGASEYEATGLGSSLTVPKPVRPQAGASFGPPRTQRRRASTVHPDGFFTALASFRPANGSDEEAKTALLLNPGEAPRTKPEPEPSPPSQQGSALGLASNRGRRASTVVAPLRLDLSPLRPKLDQYAQPTAKASAPAAIVPWAPTPTQDYSLALSQNLNRQRRRSSTVGGDMLSIPAVMPRFPFENEPKPGAPPVSGAGSIAQAGGQQPSNLVKPPPSSSGPSRSVSFSRPFTPSNNIYFTPPPAAAPGAHARNNSFRRPSPVAEEPPTPLYQPTDAANGGASQPRQPAARAGLVPKNTTRSSDQPPRTTRGGGGSYFSGPTTARGRRRLNSVSMGSTGFTQLNRRRSSSCTSGGSAFELGGPLAPGRLLPPAPTARRNSLVSWDPFALADRSSTAFFPAQHGAGPRQMSTGARSYASTVVQAEPVPRYDPVVELHAVSRVLLRLQKAALVLLFLATNGALIWAATMVFLAQREYWWLPLPVVSVNTVMQVFFALGVVVAAACRGVLRCVLFRQPQRTGPVPAVPEKMAMVLSCCGESRAEVERSLASLVRQTRIAEHPRVLLCVVDGRVTAPGEDVTTLAYLMDEVFASGVCEDFENGYVARDGVIMPLKVKWGVYETVPYMVIGKMETRGRRDSSWLVRSFLHHYQRMSSDVPTMFHPALYNCLASFLVDAGLDTVDYMCGMDGDTEFADDCTYELIKAMRRGGPQVVGVCGAVTVQFEQRPWGFWNLFQNAEYSIIQSLRREFQSRVTGKLASLPSSCHLLRITEATCGDTALRTRLAREPKPNDTLPRQAMGGSYAEAALYGSIEFPRSQTRQAVRARAHVPVPQSWGGYLARRGRWTLGCMASEFLMVFRGRVSLLERLFSLVTVVAWWFGLAVVATMGTFVIVLLRMRAGLFDAGHWATWLLVGVLGVLFVRYLYCFCVLFWLPRGAGAKVRFFVGYLIYLLFAPFNDVVVTVWALTRSDVCDWGQSGPVLDPDEESVTGDVMTEKVPEWRVRRLENMEKLTPGGLPP